LLAGALLEKRKKSRGRKVISLTNGGRPRLVADKGDSPKKNLPDLPCDEVKNARKERTDHEERLQTRGAARRQREMCGCDGGGSGGAHTPYGRGKGKKTGCSKKNTEKTRSSGV